MKHLVVFLACLALSLANQDLGRNHVQHQIRAGKVPVHGVNLGGWLVVESWINPADALWQGVDPVTAGHGEMAVMKALGHSVGDPRFQNHWNTYITEADIAEIASFDLNAVRVPIGWWIVGYDNHDPSGQEEWKVFAPGGLFYLDRLIRDWALKHNVSVLVDIHAAKGSQNGMDHSAPPDYNQAYWSQYQENIDNTVELATVLAERYRNDPAFLGIELMNEPNGVDINKLKEYYLKVNDLVRFVGNDCFLVNSPILTQQNQGTAGNWENFTPVPPYTKMWHDWHKYLIWGFEGQSAEWIITEGVATVQNDLARWTGNDIIMGEWCLASNAKFTDDLLKQYATNMFNTLRACKAGWTFWTWKQGDGSPRGDGEGGWSFRDLLRDRIVTPSMWQ